MRYINVVVIGRVAPAGEGCFGVLEGCAGIRVVAASTPEETVRNAEVWKPDVVLLELATKPRRLGQACKDIGEVCRGVADARVIVVYEDIDGNVLLDCLLAGAKGCIHRSKLPSYLEKAVRVVHQGEAWVSRRMVADLIDRFCRIEGCQALHPPSPGLTEKSVSRPPKGMC